MIITGASRCESRCDKGVSHGPPDPTRPDLYIGNLLPLSHLGARAGQGKALTR